MRRKLLWTLLFVLVAGMVAPEVAASTDGRDRGVRFRGVIAEVGDNSLVVLVGDHRVLVRVLDRTRIFLNGERVRLGALQPRDRVIVRGFVRSREGVRFVVATHIFAFRRDRSG